MNCVGTLFWHNAFSNTQLSQTLPKEVAWEDFIAALQRWFSARTGSELLDEHVKFIRRCVCKGNETVTYSSLWEQADLQARPECPIRLQFWPFFYKCTNAISELDELRLLWTSGLLYGFVSNDDAIDLLRRHAGNALIRFSNTKKCGAVVIMLSHVSNEQPCDVRVCSLKPLAVKKDSCNLLDALADIGVQLLVPNVDWKRKVCYEPPEPSLNGSEQDDLPTMYIRPISKLTVPPPDEWPSIRLVIENDGTPCATDDERDDASDQEEKRELSALSVDDFPLLSETSQLSISGLKIPDIDIFSKFANDKV